MLGKAKKTVSIAYKEKLLAEIAHYEKRIEDALNKRKQSSFSFEDEGIEDIVNPYKLNLQPSQHELKQREASLSDRASMTLELGMLTIMQSEVNVMVTPPEVRKPVPEDGIWYEVAAECKIDLVCFTITFYTHKPHRKFAPKRYRNVAVTLVKPAHQNELAHSILPKLQLPNLALQVLQSYATAVRSRRTTLLELAETYADRLRMQAMPDGGYRVKCLDLLQVEWTLENLWSPIVPFGHRMKFEVEYMPKDYIQGIGKLYKQFKDPSLGTSERTLVLSKIFDICLQAAGPARELQESFQSDPETAGRLHERRTTIDQEPDVPNVDQSPKKDSGKENKPQNSKTSMAPPKAIPKKKKRPNENMVDRKSVKRVNESESSHVSKKSRIEEDGRSKGGLKGGREGIDKGSEAGELRTKDTGKDAANRKTETLKSFGKVTAKNAKESTAEEENYVMKKRNGKTKSKGSGDIEGDGGIVNAKKNKMAAGTDTSEDVVKKRDGKTKSKGSGDIEGDGGIVNAKKNKMAASTDTSEDVVKKRDGKTKSKGSGDTEDVGIINSKNNKETIATSEIDVIEKRAGKTKSKSKSDGTEVDRDINAKKDSDIGSKGSETSSKASKNGKPTEKVKSQDVYTENSAARSKRSSENIANINDKNTVNTKDTNEERNVVSSKKGAQKINTQNKTTDKNTVLTKEAENTVSAKKDAETANKKNINKVARTKKDEGSVASSKHGTKKSEVDEVASKEENTVTDNAAKNKATNKDDGKIVASSKDKSTKDNLTNKKKVNEADAVSRGPKTVASKDDDGKTKAASKKIKSTNNVKNANNSDGSKKVAKNTDMDVDSGLGNTYVTNKTGVTKPTPKDSTSKPKDVVNSLNNKNMKENNVKQNDKVVETSKVVKEKATGTVKKTANDTNKEKAHLAEKTKVTSPKTTEQTALNKNKITAVSDKYEVLAKKRNTEDKQTTSKPEKPKSSTKPNATRILKESTNKTDNVEKIAQNKNKNQKNNLNVTITKSKIIPLSKLQVEKQTKIADKLKTKIPMMKSKMTFSSLGDKLKMNNLASISKGMETKIPKKSLPVFKRVNNVPTRMSPRKLPTFKPSGHGFSNK